VLLGLPLVDEVASVLADPLLVGDDEVEPKLVVGDELAELIGVVVGELAPVLKLPYDVSPWSPIPSKSRPNEFQAQ